MMKMVILLGVLLILVGIGVAAYESQNMSSCNSLNSIYSNGGYSSSCQLDNDVQIGGVLGAFLGLMVVMAGFVIGPSRWR